MEKINLLTLYNIITSFSNFTSEDNIKKYLGILKLKPREVLTVQRLCEAIKSKNISPHLFENYCLNYEIPQIGKEFDILRIGHKSILNIELKSQNMQEEDILKQLKRNYYYLSFLGKPLHCFTFITDEDKDLIYYYDIHTNKLKLISDINFLIELIIQIEDIDEENFDVLFNPSNYLISPFNTTDAFIKNEYFLTKHQETIRDTIAKEILSNAKPDVNRIFSLSGAAGTGKTLLTYDIAKHLISKGIKVSIIHCAQSNPGISKLNSVYLWSIIEIKYYKANSLDSDVLIFDESQRINMNQLNDILTNEKKFIIFSHDVKQRLNPSNQAEQVVNMINEVAVNNHFELTRKIRHNTSLASFISKLYNFNNLNKDNLSKSDYNNVSFYFAKDNDDADTYTKYLATKNWEYIYLTPSRINPDVLDNIKFSSDKSSHTVIGQEYDNVVVVINEYFYYTHENILSYNARHYYNPLETLFQAITRTRKKLQFVIINNEDFYKKCIQIINR